MLYTFLPIAPCTFFLSGKRFDIKVNEPFSVNLKEAKIISSSTFAYRKYVRLITPLPEENPPEPVLLKPKPKPELEPKPEPKVEVQVESKSEPKVEVQVESKSEPKVEVQVEPKIEVQEEAPKRRSRKKFNVEES